MPAYLRFLLAVVLWSFIISAWIYVRLFSPNNYLGLFLPPLVLGVTGSAITQMLVSRIRTVPLAILGGLFLGALLPIVGGYIGMKIAGGFESASVFAFGVILAIPSAIGGAIASWIQFRFRPIPA